MVSQGFWRSNVHPTAAELSGTLPTAALLSQTVRAVLLTSVAMFMRNAALLGLFGRSAVRFAVLPLFSMMTVAGYFAFRHKEVESDAKDLELHLASPVSLSKVANFIFLFLAIQIAGTLAVRWLGNSGVLIVSVIGGTVSSASTTAAVANLVTHGSVSALQAGTATVLTSIASTGMNLPLVRRQINDKGIVREIMLATGLQAVVGTTVIFFERWFIR
jgi:uncharacterized membrane protein (DUF4010 family)